MKLGSDLGDSLTLKFAQTARALKQKGREILSLGLGEPDFQTPSYIVQATYEAMLAGYTRYSDALGLPELRQAIAEKLRDDNGCGYEANQVVVTPGAKQAIFLSLCALLEPGDEVVNFTPYYVSYVPMARIAEPGSTIHHIQMSRMDFSIDLDEVKAAINDRTKVMLLNTPNNPTGKIIGGRELEALARLSREHGFYIVSDEIYEKLCFGASNHISIASYEGMEDRVFLVNGFSKAYSMTGWRIGYVACPKPFVSVMSKLQQHINTNTCTFVQKGAIAALQGDHSFLYDYNASLSRRFEVLRDFLTRHDEVRCTLPGAGFFAFVDISAFGMSSNDFCSRLLEETGVAVTPGVAFGVEWDDHVRISLAVDEVTLAKALGLMELFMSREAR